MRKKGEIAVFLALLLSVLSALVVALTQNVRKHVAKSEAAFAADAAIRSCFAEYNKAIFDRFHIYLVDSSYKSEENGESNTAEHFAVYMQANMSVDELCGVEVIAKRSVSQDNCEYLYKSAVNYARNKGLTDAKTDEEAFADYLYYVCGYYENGKLYAAREGELEYLLYGFEDDTRNITIARMEYEQSIENESMPADDTQPERMAGSVKTVVRSFSEENVYENYGEYLKARLSEEGILQLRRRFGELLEEYAANNGSPAMQLSECYDYISVNALVLGSNNREISVTREYEYASQEI